MNPKNIVVVLKLNNGKFVPIYHPLFLRGFKPTEIHYFGELTDPFKEVLYPIVTTEGISIEFH